MVYIYICAYTTSESKLFLKFHEITILEFLEQNPIQDNMTVIV